jgi:hypothetical protein
VASHAGQVDAEVCDGGPSRSAASCLLMAQAAIATDPILTIAIMILDDIGIDGSCFARRDFGVDM